MSNLKPPLKIVFIKHSKTDSGNKLGMMIGMSSGAKNNKLIGSSKNIEYYPI